MRFLKDLEGNAASRTALVEKVVRAHLGGIATPEGITVAEVAIFTMRAPFLEGRGFKEEEYVLDMESKDDEELARLVSEVSLDAARAMFGDSALEEGGGEAEELKEYVAAVALALRMALGGKRVYYGDEEGIEAI